MPLPFRFDRLRDGYRSKTITPTMTVDTLLRQIAGRGDDHVWSALASPTELRARAHELEERIADLDRLPLYGIPFGVKDNLDVAGVPTTCGCPGFARMPTVSAQAVQRVLDAGAIFVGKQTLDQFATGLNGTRTLSGHCRNVFDDRVIPGGSSSGSGVAVAAGLVGFSLGSDTGGSGRVPAAMNNIVGLRPTVGLAGSRGMVYNNRLFDCIPVFAPTVEEAFAVLEIIAGCDADDPIARADNLTPDLRAEAPAQFTFAIPDRIECFGDRLTAALFERAVQRLERLGGSPMPIDLTEFLEAGQMIFDSALVAERAASYGEALVNYPDQLVPAVASILERANTYTAADAFKAQYRLSRLRCAFATRFACADVLVTPTVPRPYTVAEMLAEPLVRNAEVGYYTYGVGPLDLCALAIPAALREDGLPFGISLVARAGADGQLRSLGRRFEADVAIPPGIDARE